MQSENIDGRIDALNQVVVSMAVESWRLSRVLDRLLSRMDAGEQARYRSQFRWFMKKMEESLSQVGLAIVNVEGQPFDPGMAVAPLNIAEFEANDSLVVDQMIEPIVMNSEGLVRSGTATLKKVLL